MPRRYACEPRGPDKAKMMGKRKSHPLQEVHLRCSHQAQGPWPPCPQRERGHRHRRLSPGQVFAGHNTVIPHGTTGSPTVQGRGLHGLHTCWQLPCIYSVAHRTTGRTEQFGTGVKRGVYLRTRAVQENPASVS